MSAKANYINGRRFHRTLKEIDRLHAVIDRRARIRKNNRNILRSHKEINPNGRVWSF